MSRHDLFICHASLDKPHFVEPLAKALKRRDLEIWYDDFSLKPGDSVRRAIEHGIRDSSAGLVVLSPRFFDREWPQRELDALVSLEISGKKRVIPIWLDLDHQSVSDFSPLLADRKAIIATSDIEALANQIAEALPSVDATDEEVDAKISFRFTRDRDQKRYLKNISLLNLSRIVALWNGYDRIFLETQDLPEEVRDEKVEAWLSEAYSNLQIPYRVYVDNMEKLSAEEVSHLERSLQRWCMGTLGSQESVDLMFYLDEGLDTDYLYIMFDLPNYKVTISQRQRINESIARIGARNQKNPERELSFDDHFKQSFTKFYKRSM